VAPALAGPLRRRHRGRDRSASPGARAVHGMTRGRALRIVVTLVVTGACLAYILWQLDVTRTVRILVHADFAWFAAAFVVMVIGVPPMAWRWQQLLAARGMHENLPWLNRAYFVAYTAGQVLPTAVGGDASRIFETSRRHPGRLGDVTAIVLLERALGGVATLILAAIGFALAVGTYDVGGYLWVELSFVVGAAVLGVVLFSTRLHPLLQLTRPLLRRLRIERPLRDVYIALHSFRGEVPLLT